MTKLRGLAEHETIGDIFLYFADYNVLYDWAIVLRIMCIVNCVIRYASQHCDLGP